MDQIITLKSRYDDISWTKQKYFLDRVNDIQRILNTLQEFSRILLRFLSSLIIINTFNQTKLHSS